MGDPLGVWGIFVASRFTYFLFNSAPILFNTGRSDGKYFEEDGTLDSE